MRALVALWRREPHVGVPAAVGALAVVAMLPYLYVRQFRLMLGEANPFILDFSYFYEAAARFVADPLTLYTGAEGFIYPPPSVVAFVPWLALPEGIAYVAFAVAGLGVMAAAVLVGLGLYERAREERLTPALKASLVLVALGSGPTFQHVKFGQVGALVLLAGVLWLRWAGGRRPWAAGLALGAGFWLKLYPIVLLPMGLGPMGRAPAGSRRRALVGMALGLLGPPLALLAVVPPALYSRYVVVVLPHVSATTDPYVLNGSVVGVVMRMEGSRAAFGQSYEVAVSTPAHAAAIVVAGALLGGLTLAGWSGRLRPDVAGIGMLAAIPVLSGLGWEHTYVLALPLAVFALLEARHRSRTARTLTAAAVLALMVPTPPRVVLQLLVAHAPRPALDLVYARPLLLTLGLLAAVVAWSWQRAGPSGRGLSPQRGG